MPRYSKRDFEIGGYWLGQRSGSPAWYRCWVEGARTKRASLNTADYEEAKTALAEWYVLHREASNEKPQEVSMASIIDRYWDGHAKNLPRSEVVKTHRKHWKEHFPDQTVSEATAFTAQEEFKKALRAGGLKDISINHVTSTGRAALRYAWKKGELTSVPPLTMLPVGDQPPMGEPLSVPQARKLLGQLHGHVWLLNVLLLGTCARPSAVMQLDWSQVDFEHDLIRLNAEGRAQNKKRRPVVKIPPFLRAILWPIKQDDGPVVAFEGAAVKSVKTAFRKARKRAELDDRFTLYSWRHTLARWMRSQRVSQWEVQGQLGHRSAGTTERYAEYAPDFQAEATKAIELFWQRVSANKPVTRQEPLAA